VNAAPEKTAGGVMFCIGLAAFGVLAWGARRMISLERAVDIGDAVVFGVFAIFGAFCLLMGWRLLRSRSTGFIAAATEPAPAPPARRVTLSQGCAAVGVVLLILCVLVPGHWYPVLWFFLGLALLAVSHVLTPCVERLEQLRKARDSMRQL
jgi:hypothetical protein